MGTRYVIYRVKYELKKKLGTLKNTHPIYPNSSKFIDLEEWRKNTPMFLIPEREKIIFKKEKTKIIKEKFERILKGEICFFSYEWKNIGLEYDWITNPETGFKYDITNHWSKINDFNAESGDIKYLWEKSRFTFLLTIIRNDYHFDEDHSELVFSQIEDWIDKNPINQGPNWFCSQEISLRIFNWCYALYFYKNTKSLTEKRWDKIQNSIYWSLHHVYNNIDFSRIAVRNNHAITETLLLTLSELLFPFIPETKKWAKKGRRWFEQEIAYQVYEDGTFLQFSMNYQRVIVQLFSLGIAVTELHKKAFSKTVYDRAYKTVDFLYQCMQEENGFLPNYGTNDGALFFPLSDANFRDYRPQLNTLHIILTNTRLYDDTIIVEDSCWMLGNKLEKNNYLENLEKKSGCISFPIGGFYLLREKETFTFIRCGNHKDRPAHADNLHLDIWKQGVNVMRDSGTYKYNTEKIYQDYFTGSISHNTVVVENYSQMLKGSRFIWYFWSQSKNAGWKETEDNYIFNGTVSAFRFLNPKAIHARTIYKSKINHQWMVEDVLGDLEGRKKTQVWNHNDSRIDFKAMENNIKLQPEMRVSYDSPYYGLKNKEVATVFSFNNEIRTLITVH